MLYALLFYGRESDWGAKEPAERRKQMDAHIREVNRLLVDGALVTSARLLNTDSATTVRAAGDKVVVLDGPFAETKEQLAGLQIINCPDLDEAIRYAKMFVAEGGTVEIRPVHPDPGSCDLWPDDKR